MTAHESGKSHEGVKTGPGLAPALGLNGMATCIAGNEDGVTKHNDPVAQLDRALVYEAGGWGIYEAGGWGFAN